MINKFTVALFILTCIHCVYAQPLKYKGYPSREGKIDIRSNFKSPIKGYGNVPFYWWNGDSLKYERLMNQLSILEDASTDGMSVSYIHTHPAVDVKINSKGYGSFGRADGGIPEFYTDEWWSLWNKFSGECAKRNIGLGLDDYVVGWAKNGYYVDEVLRMSDIRSYQGRLHCQSYTVNPGQSLSLKLPEHTLTVTTYPGMIDLTSLAINGCLEWNCDAKEEQKVYVISTTSAPELHPQYGKRLVEAYFNRFEERLDKQGKKGLNYFFQDELHYELNIHSWSEDMREEFKRRKGYDIFPFLPALWGYIGSVTPKIRLDYAQVVTELAEERYFKPIFNWHNERGLIYGCDNAGRGLEPLQYMDYFRAISWFTAPGNDAPARGSSFRQTKVSSSVTHLYKRPRTWLEAFHSMGWDSNGEWLTSQLDHHLIAGGNLVCLHGLYYSTHGGWWEWAPPCFHFRMPYWPHMKRWLKYAERMSFVLSQGIHACDVAVMYPTETLQAYPDTNIDLMWKVTDKLSACGLDYDFIDYQSIQQADIESGELCVADEKYKVLILANIKALHYETLLKVYEFYKKGGLVLAIGDSLKATSRVGEFDSQAKVMWNEIFEGKGAYEPDVDAVVKHIRTFMTPDFYTESGEGKVLHRQIGQQDVYMVMNIHEGDKVFFRSRGKLECWDAWNGEISEMPVLEQTDEGTWIKYMGTYNESKLLVFSPGEPLKGVDKRTTYKFLAEKPVYGEWDIEIVPTMNNKWGDFRLPATNELIGPEARDFSYQFLPVEQKDKKCVDSWNGTCGVYGYAPYMETLTLPASSNLIDCLSKDLSNEKWIPYCYSWQYGVFDNPGSQGYHGLKGKVDNRFIILDQGGHQIFRTYVYAPSDGEYRIEREGKSPDYLYLDASLISQSVVRMKKGWHHLILAYANTLKGGYVLEEKKSYSVDDRERSAVVFYPVSVPPVVENYPYDTIVTMKWYQTKHLEYSTKGNVKGMWAYRFQTAPGTREMSMNLNGKIKNMWINGILIDKKALKRVGKKNWVIDLHKYYASGVADVIITAFPDCGADGPAFFAEPVKMKCSGGKVLPGNWTKYGAMKFYSGGVRYMKQVTVNKEDLDNKIMLDLGEVNATCEVSVNGKSVDVLMHSPYVLDISEFLKNGNNKIEVLVYSTLSNHYQTIPSAYRGKPISGLMGPIRLLIYECNEN